MFKQSQTNPNRFTAESNPNRGVESGLQQSQIRIAALKAVYSAVAATVHSGESGLRYEALPLNLKAIPSCVCVFITAGPSTKQFARWGGIGGHVLRETTCRGREGGSDR